MKDGLERPEETMLLDLSYSSRQSSVSRSKLRL